MVEKFGDSERVSISRNKIFFILRLLKSLQVESNETESFDKYNISIKWHP